MNYHLPWCFYDGMEGYLQGDVSVGEKVRALNGMTDSISSGKWGVMLNKRLLVSRWHAKRFGVSNVGKVVVKKTPDKIYVQLVDSSIAFIYEFDFRGVSW